VEIDLIANDGGAYLIGECKWRNEKIDLPVLQKLREKTDIFQKQRADTWYILFSKTGFAQAVQDEAAIDDRIILVDIKKLLEKEK